MNESVLETGNEVGDLAMGLFGDYVEVPFGNLDEMIERTSELLADGTPIIAEASFSYNGLFCSVDILKNLGSGVLIHMNVDFLVIVRAIWGNLMCLMLLVPDLQLSLSAMKKE